MRGVYFKKRSKIALSLMLSALIQRLPRTAIQYAISSEEYFKETAKLGLTKYRAESIIFEAQNEVAASANLAPTSLFIVAWKRAQAEAMRGTAS